MSCERLPSTPYLSLRLLAKYDGRTAANWFRSPVMNISELLFAPVVVTQTHQWIYLLTNSLYYSRLEVAVDSVNDLSVCRLVSLYQRFVNVDQSFIKSTEWGLFMNT